MSDSQKPFVHLHVHTEFSTSQGRDGLSKIPKLVARAKELEMPALAITDHANMFGAMNFYRACKDAGIKPIIGVETYLAEGDRTEKDSNYKRQTHLLLIAKNKVGYQNLLKIVSESQLTGFYQRPRVDKQLLAAYAEGIICTSGCLSGEIPKTLFELSSTDDDLPENNNGPLSIRGDENKARRLIGEYQDIFGKENFFLELQSHERLNDNLNRWLIDNQAYADAPLLATNDVHYILDEDYDAHDFLTCILKNKTFTDPRRLKHPRSLHLRSAQEMWDLFGDSAPSSLYNTVLIAEMCELDLDDRRYHLPVFPVPQGYDATTYLRALARRGAEWRYGSDWAKFWPRLEYELGIINKMGFDTYFLIVWDLLQFARHADIWWNVRGSGAGSAVAYCLGITNLDPIPNNLIFERFLNPGRVSMPDIDIDFPDDRRFEMIEYAKRKYGEDKVAAIITFSQLKAKAAIVNMARVLEYPLDKTRQLSALVPAIPSRPVTLAQCLSDDPDYAVNDLKDLYNSDSVIRRVLDSAVKIEGTVSHVGTHAAGVIVSDKPLVQYLPLHRPTASNEDSVPIKQVTQFPMEICESIGLLKVDFLGLSTLTIMRKACELIERYHGQRYTLENIPYRPDPQDPEQARMVREAFDLMGSGEVTGVFQLESQGMRKMLVDMKPKTFEHVTAAISLYRPGPMQFIDTFVKRMHNEEPIEYLHPKLEPILAETMGICVYQEQIQQIAAQLFGYSLGDADLMRRAVSKKKAKDLAKHKEIFMEKGPDYGVSAETASKIFDQIEFFAAYGFNKSHAADYAVLTCQSAFLKAHYAAEYYIALLTVQRDVTEDVTLFTSDCRRLGIPILPPDINFSELDFTIEDYQGVRSIRFGLGAIKFVSAEGARQIAQERADHGLYQSLLDFCQRVDLRSVGSKGLESLIRVGVFDAFGKRDVLLFNAKRLLETSKSYHDRISTGQVSMFGAASVLAESDADLFLKIGAGYVEQTKREMLRWEKDLIGLYISDHPLNALASAITHIGGHVYSGELKKNGEEYHGRSIAVAGLVTGIRTLITKKGDPMAIITCEDMQGVVEAVFFPRTWAKYREQIAVDQVFVLRGKADTAREGQTPQLIVDTISQDFDYVTSAGEAAPSPDVWTTAAYDEPYGGRSLPASDGMDEAFLAPLAEEPADLASEGYEVNRAIAEAAPGRQRPSARLSASGANGHAANGQPGPVSDHSVAQGASRIDEPSNGWAPDLDGDFDAFLREEDGFRPPSRQVVLTLQPLPAESGARMQHLKKIKYLYNRLIESPGGDQLSFRVADDQQIYLLEFPQTPVNFDEVEGKLRQNALVIDVQISDVQVSDAALQSS